MSRVSTSFPAFGAETLLCVWIWTSNGTDSCFGWSNLPCRVPFVRSDSSGLTGSPPCRSSSYQMNCEPGYQCPRSPQLKQVSATAGPRSLLCPENAICTLILAPSSTVPFIPWKADSALAADLYETKAKPRFNAISTMSPKGLHALYSMCTDTRC